MATSTQFPSNASTADIGSETNNDWRNPSNITADDGAVADIISPLFDGPDISWRLVGNQFGFAIDSGASIYGIEVGINAFADAGSAVDYRFQLVDENDALVGNDNADTVTGWPGSPSVTTYGSATTIWGWGTVTPTKLNNANFGVAVAAQATAANTDVNVDFIRVHVTYEPAAAGDGSGAGYQQYYNNVVLG